MVRPASSIALFPSDSVPLFLERLTEIFADNGILADRLPGYEPRPGQLAMASVVGKALLAGATYPAAAANILAVEAGTGIGKTLAYLVPAALSGQRVIVSTNTLNLQEQILSKEIPFIQKHIAPFLTAMCVKGRQNYLCLHKWQQFVTDPQGHLFGADFCLCDDV